MRWLVPILVFLSAGCNIGFESTSLDANVASDISDDVDVDTDASDTSADLDVTDVADAADATDAGDADTAETTDTGPWVPNLGPQGFGSMATGGAAGSRVAVTTLADDGPGSLREAVAMDSVRIEFDVEGVIDLETRLELTTNNITIDGSTAPGAGVVIAGRGIEINGRNIVLRHLRIRPGATGRPTIGSDADAIHMGDGARQVFIEHCSIAWYVDEAVAALGELDFVTDITVQYSLMGESVDPCRMVGACNQGGVLMRNTRRMSVHHNAMISNFAQNPQLQAEAINLEFINNIVHNYADGAYLNGDAENQRIDIIGTIYRQPVDPLQYEIRGLFTTGSAILYVEDVLGPHREPNGPQESAVDPGLATAITTLRNPMSTVQVDPVEQLESWMLDEVGATLPCRDTVDARLIEEMRSGAGAFITDASDVGASATNVNCAP